MINLMHNDASPDLAGFDGQPGHLVQFYSADDLLLQSLQRIIGGALGSGDSAVVIATQEHRRALAQRLKWCGIDLPLAQTSRRYREVDAATALAALDHCKTPLDVQTLLHQTIFGADTPPRVEDQRIVVFGEVVGIMWERGQFKDMASLESGCNTFLAERPLTMLCGYPIQRINTLKEMGPFAEICRAHSGVISDDGRMEVVSQWRPAESKGAGAAWMVLYAAAMHEPDRLHLFKKIETAEAVILERIETPGSTAEERPLLEALARLLMLKRQKLGF